MRITKKSKPCNSTLSKYEWWQFNKQMLLTNKSITERVTKNNWGRFLTSRTPSLSPNKHCQSTERNLKHGHHPLASFLLLSPADSWWKGRHTSSAMPVLCRCVTVKQLSTETVPWPLTNPQCHGTLPPVTTSRSTAHSNAEWLADWQLLTALCCSSSFKASFSLFLSSTSCSFWS